MISPLIPVCPACGTKDNVLMLRSVTAYSRCSEFEVDADGEVCDIDWEEEEIGTDGEHDGYQCGKCYQLFSSLAPFFEGA